jgi:lysophospholipase L1-like esterase
MPWKTFAILVAVFLPAGRLPLHAAAPAAGKAAGPASRNVHLRGSLANCRVQFQKHHKGHVAFMGGSITEMNGYRPMVCEILPKRFPDAKLTFTDAGIASTCSTTGAFRLAADVLARGPVDLFFVEFAVNDDQDAGHARRECIRGMEGIIRRARQHDPNMDIVVTCFVNPGMLKTIQDGKTPLTIAAHEEVARHYGLSTVNLAKEVAERIAAGTLTWKAFGGTHPAPLGNAICAGMIDGLLSAAWKDPLPAAAAKVPHPTPPEPLDERSYFRGRFVEPKDAVVKGAWTLRKPDWKKLPGQCRARFADIPLLCADRPGAELMLDFTGTAVGAYVLAGPDAGSVEAAVDGGPAKPVDLYHRFSRGLHYPRTVMFEADLKPGKHALTLRVSDRKDERSSGTAVRVVQFVAN